jgi:hypothetical protein
VFIDSKERGGENDKFLEERQLIEIIMVMAGVS